MNGVQADGTADEDNIDVALPKSLPLRDWISRFAKTATPSAQVGMVVGRVDKTYLEKASRVALSLAEQLAKQYDANPADLTMDVCVDNAVVTDTSKGEASFGEASDISSGNDASSPQDERAIIAWLGRVYYELFTQKPFPSPSPSSEESEGTPGEASFDCALNIKEAEDDGQEPDDQNRRQKQRRVVDDGTQQRHHDLSRLPNPARRLVSDMLENESFGSGGLFRHDEAVASLSDVVCDVRQMVQDPKSYLHDSILMRWEPVIPEDRMYGRNDELRQCLEMARKVSESTEHSQSAIMISACAGTGKTTFVREVRDRLEGKGWQCLDVKFGQEVQPLIQIASAFDRFLTDNVVHGPNDVVQRRIKADIVTAFDSGGGIEVLGQLVPTLRTMVAPNERAEIQTQPFGVRDAPASTCRINRLFGILLRIISNERPIMVSFDDLHNSDISTIELIQSMIESIDEYYINEELDGSGYSHVLFLGCFRPHEGANHCPVAEKIQQMCSDTNLNQIELQGLTCEDVNAMVSDSLLYPRRLTKSLAGLIFRKTIGNPLHIREMINSLATENLLTYSLSKHEWRFDLELIELRTVTGESINALCVI